MGHTFVARTSALRADLLTCRSSFHTPEVVGWLRLVDRFNGREEEATRR
jgi:hypothetical protein